MTSGGDEAGAQSEADHQEGRNDVRQVDKDLIPHTALCRSGYGAGVWAKADTVLKVHIKKRYTKMLSVHKMHRGTLPEECHWLCSSFSLYQ